MHDYYRIKLSESLIFLGFSSVLAIDLMGVIWRENVKFLKNAKTIDFTRFQYITTIFLTMYRERHKIENPISSSNYKGLNHFFCIYIYSNGIQRNKNYRIMLSRNRWKALFTMVWGWLFSSLIWRGNIFCVLDTKNTPTILYNCWCS